LNLDCDDLAVQPDALMTAGVQAGAVELDGVELDAVRRQGFPIADRPRADGMLEPAGPGTFELACTSGALGKCVRFGYPPWGAAKGVPLRDVYNACIRMVRADYCGDGTPATKDGERIDIYDDLAIQTHVNEATMDFEAGWTADGAVCVRHVRVKENTSLESLVAACPRLKDRVRAGVQRPRSAVGVMVGELADVERHDAQVGAEATGEQDARACPPAGEGAKPTDPPDLPSAEPHRRARATRARSPDRRCASTLRRSERQVLAAYPS
jgi:hypothetical protein